MTSIFYHYYPYVLDTPKMWPVSYIFQFLQVSLYITIATALCWNWLKLGKYYTYFIEIIIRLSQKYIEKSKADTTDDDEDDEDTNPNPNQIKRRTPDAPPVFLLGDNRDEGQHEFRLDDPCALVRKGITAIIDDAVTKRFETEELRSWNLLNRTNPRNYQFISPVLGLSWLAGFVIRYFIFLPLRVTFTFTGIIWLIITMALVGCVPKSFRSKVYWHNSLMCFRMLSCGITAILEFHNQEYRAQCGDICVANHTSPIDALLLACDNCYALVGQRHGGLLGLLETALSRAAKHVWFDRSEMRDRLYVAERLKQHVSVKTNLPVLIFPEGTCINNSAVMMFRKGSFEVTDRVCPVAMKYDARFGDPFWNSSKQSFAVYLLLMMCSWAIKCDVWYLPPMDRQKGESSAEFANRVKAEIAKQAGIEDLSWDGQLKRSAVKESWKHQQQEDYAKRLKLE